MRTSQTEATYALLIDYASNQALRQEFTATQDVISEWTGIPSRTLRRHVAQLVSQRKLSIRYTGDGIVYSLPDGVVKIPRIREVITESGFDPTEHGVVLPWYSGHLADAGLETQHGMSDGDYQPAEWSPAWGRFFRFPPVGCHDDREYSEADIERSIFHHRGEASDTDVYAGDLPF